MKKVKWGILGAGNIAHRFAKALEYIEEAELYAIAVRNIDKGLSFQKEFNCSKIYTSYEDFLDDPEIECVYISLPNSLHHQYSLLALKKGKYVLCEKPATINLEQILEIEKFAKENNAFFMEAMKQRFVPVYQDIKKDVLKLGKIISISTKFCREERSINPNSYYFKPGEGGCLLDTGIYCASWLDDFSSGDITLLEKTTHIDKEIDNYNKALLKAGDISLYLENGKENTEPVNCVIKGENGYIEIFNHHRPQEYRLCINGEDEIAVKKEYDHDDFYSEIKHVNDAFINGKKESEIMPLSASVRCAKILQLIRDGKK